MSQSTILHLFGWDKKFVPPFIVFVREHFDDAEHRYIIYGQVNDSPLPAGPNVIHYPSLLKNLPALLAQIRAAKKVILHGLFSSHLFYALALQPWALKKCYWTIWGGDLYIHNKEFKDRRDRKNEWFRRFVISRLGHFITHIEGDYKLAQQWYSAKGQWHECFTYSSNLYKDYQLQPKAHGTINIQVGNSADPSNNHLEMLEKLKAFEDQAIRIYVPLSYGDLEYAKKIISYGIENFGENFIPLTEFMPFEKYLDLLAKIDIAIFNHKRQQGIGNITTLLGLEKKVYIRSDVTPWTFFNDIGVTIFDLDHFNTSPIDPEVSKKNQTIISSFFSEKNLMKQLEEIFS
ncbi:MAG: TDP-N-acetylfucosamine:lipid II N-acetylfucosaminyltransferase [Limnohabitans sp.]